MGLMSNILGGSLIRDLGNAVQGTAEIFHANESEKARMDTARMQTAIGQYKAEFAHAHTSWFGGLVDGLNRLPRPLMAFGTIGLFVYAMVDPVSFSQRMAGLAAIPEPLWWLLGAIVGFYFGARELHHHRSARVILPPAAAPAQIEAAKEGVANVINAVSVSNPTKTSSELPTSSDNSAISEWLTLGRED